MLTDRLSHVCITIIMDTILYCCLTNPAIYSNTTIVSVNV